MKRLKNGPNEEPDYSECVSKNDILIIVKPSFRTAFKNEIKNITFFKNTLFIDTLLYPIIIILAIGFAFFLSRDGYQTTDNVFN